MKDDTISRQAALDAIFSEPLYKSGMKKRDADVVVPAIYEKIKSLPPVQPNHNAEVGKMEIVHCKDCKHWKERPLYTYCEKLYRMGVLDLLNYATGEDDFCSWAEKRGEAE